MMPKPVSRGKRRAERRTDQEIRRYLKRCEDWGGWVCLTAWSHEGRVRSEAAFASLAGVSPIPHLPATPSATDSIAAATEP
jgi:hypothetical protein